MNLDDNKYYLQALEYINSHDLDELNALETGKHIIDGDNVILNINDSKLKTVEEARLEVHDKYIDIQIPLSKEESFGVKPRKDCIEPDGEFNTEKDILFYKDKDWTNITVKVGEAITFDPDTAHAPLIGEGVIHKAIFKVKVV